MSEAPPTCTKCSQPVAEGVRVGNMTFHPECFLCTACGKAIEGGELSMTSTGVVCLACTPKAPTPTAAACAKCQQPLSGKVIQRGANKIHLACFVCEVCKCDLGGGFFENDDKVYCPTHYAELRGNKCHGCQQAITGEALSALNHTWHPACFVCTSCKKPISGSVAVANGNPYCGAPACRPSTTPTKPAAGVSAASPAASSTPPAAAAAASPSAASPSAAAPASKPAASPSGAPASPSRPAIVSGNCAKCKQAIGTGPAIGAADREYHPRCFKCCEFECRKELNGEQFGIAPDGKPWCIEHYNQNYKPKCAACKQPVVGDIVTALGKQWHDACFVCARCGKAFEEGRYVVSRDKETPYCGAECATPPSSKIGGR